VWSDDLIIALDEVAQYSVVYDTDVMKSSTLIFHLNVREVKTSYTDNTRNNNTTTLINNRDSVYGAVITTNPLQEFTRFIS